MFKLEKINNVRVKSIKSIETIPPEKIKGYDLIKELYANIFLIAKKKSGKTSLIWKLIKHCSNKYTKFYIFSSTVSKDPTWIHIIDELKKRGNEVEAYTSIEEKGINILSDIIEELKEQAKQERLEEERKQIEAEQKKKGKNQFNPFSLVGGRSKIIQEMFNEEQEGEEEDKPVKLKKIAPEIMFILDDMDQSLRNEAVTDLLKYNRHWRSKCILSSQWPLDVNVGGRKQLDVVILFRGHSLDKLKIIHDNLDLPIDFNAFVELYKNATFEPFNFLYIDTNNTEFRKNFNQKYRLD